jgi:hypothetical protein
VKDKLLVWIADRSTTPEPGFEFKYLRVASEQRSRSKDQGAKIKKQRSRSKEHEANTNYQIKNSKEIQV